MLSLGWIMKQQQCGVVKLTLENSDLDIHLFKQLCDALEQNRSIQELNLNNNEGLLEMVEVAETLGAAVTSVTHLCELELEQCDLSAPVIDCCLGRTFSRGGQLLTPSSVILIQEYNLLCSLNNKGLPEMVKVAEAMGTTPESVTSLHRLQLFQCDLS
ncbi:hypothetical protein LSAT2_030980 [Lamellibrachia satsuma]|nr:hypothetical protein LSAT2_030980 [Lamellibrachia satsuma]